MDGKARGARSKDDESVGCMGWLVVSNSSLLHADVGERNESAKG